MTPPRAGTAVVAADLEEAAGVALFGGRPPGGTGAPLVSNARLAIVLFMASETMLFAALLGTFVIFRISSPSWPPLGQPYLPIAVTWINTAVLLLSAVAMRRAIIAVGRNQVRPLQTYLLAAGVLGTTFLCVQGFEWVRLIRHGLTMSSSMYGATFYFLIGLHGLHVMGAVVWLLAVLAGAMRGRYDGERRLGVELCGMYWYYVSVIWLALFGLVYLA